MIEPHSPVTIRIRYTPYPALRLPGDDDVKLKPNAIILRHRHLKQWHTVISTRVAADAVELPVRKSTCGYPVAFLSAPPMPRTLPLSALEGSAGQEPYPPSEPAASAAIATLASIPGPGLTPAHGVNLNTTTMTTQHRNRGILKTMPRTTMGSNTAMAMRAVSATPATSSHVNGDATAVATVAQEDSRRRSKTPAICDPSVPSLVVRQHEHFIRERPEKTIWFSSQSKEFLDAPASIDPSRLVNGALFVHTVSGDRQQIWLWVTNKWTPVERYHPHPYLPDYVLNILSNGKPSWVTSETVRTYKGRLRKREREQSSKQKLGEGSA